MKWTVTDPSCNQKMRVIAEGYLYEFEEERGLPGKKEIFRSTIDLTDYTEDEVIEACKTFGYTEDEILSFLDNQPEVVAECLFELET